jgi:phospholipid/cholesterol/gamma-HCH transport system substrate-binding protein
MAYISGIIIFFSILILMISIITLAGKRIMFTRDYIIYAKFSDVIGLQDQAKVFMRGYRVGWTKDVKFVEDGVLVRIDINKRFKIPKDSRFEINTISLIGEKAITIQPGHSTEYLKQGDMIVGYNKDLVIEMKHVIEKLNRDLDKGEISARVKDLSESIVKMKQVLTKFNQKLDKLDVKKINESVTQLANAGKKLNTFMDKNSGKLGESIRKFAVTLDRINKLTVQMTAIAKKINEGKGSAGMVVNNKKYIQKLDSTITEINALVKDVKKNPKKYINLSIF